MRVLVVAAHPDDEALGAGATIHALSSAGHDVFTCILSCCSPTRIDDLSAKVKMSDEILGIKESVLHQFDCMKLHQEDHHAMVSSIESCIKEFEPDIVITHLPTDIHVDHQTVHQCCMEACRLPQRQIGYKKPITKVLGMEVPSSTDWSYRQPNLMNVFFSVKKEDIEAKLASYSVYDAVTRDYPHPRSPEAVRALAVSRGAQSGIGLCEAFSCLYEVNAL